MSSMNMARSQMIYDDVISEISPDDDMFEGDLDHYNKCGIQLARLAATHVDASTRLLEIPCGHGRVTRYLLKHFDRQLLWTADVLPSAIEFQRNVLGVQSILVNAKSLDYSIIPDGMDAILVGSLITHLTIENCLSFIDSMHKKLNSGGMLIVTTLGVRSYELLKQAHIYQTSEHDRRRLLNAYESHGAMWASYVDQHTFEKRTVATAGQDYGITLMHKDWLLGRMNEIGFVLDSHMVAGWDDHQDVFIFKKS